MNLDNEYEMTLVDRLLGTSCRDRAQSHVGLRINPVVGPGTIESLSTATQSSKFGLPLTVATRSKIVQLFKQYEWLCGVHFHVGSQGVPLDMFVRASKICADLVADIEKVAGRRLKFIDIGKQISFLGFTRILVSELRVSFLGGGLSSSYVSSDEPDSSSYGLYRSQLEAAAPSLFSGKYRLVTEFGRSLLLKAGLSLTRVEYVKNWLEDVR